MLAPLFHHIQNQFFTFIYADIDSLLLLRDFLYENDFNVYLNPSYNDPKKNPLNENSIILRRWIERGKSEGKVAGIEKILVDLFVESKRLNLIERAEYEKIFNNILNGYLINFSNLLDYAQRRKNREEFQNLITKYTNVTFSQNVTLR